MTAASAARRARRLERGRPRQDERDQLVIDVACAFATAYGLGPQRARDLALGALEGVMTASTGKLSFGLGRPIKGRSETVRGKLKRARAPLRPRPAVASAIVLLIRGKDEAAIKRCLRSLLTMEAIRAEQTKKLIERLLPGGHIL
jgi:hypothetical protein